MKDLFLTALEISLSTSFVVAFLLLTSRLLNRRYAVKWKYGIWIALALRLILPFKMSLPQKEIVLDVPARLADPVASSVTVMAVAPDVAQTAAAQSLSMLDILAIVWLAGAALFLLTHLLSYAHYRRTVLKHGQRVTDVNVLRQIRSISQELSIRRRMPVIQDITASTPMVIGFVRPILVMPDIEYQPMELYFVLKHELIHLKRGDMFAKLLFVAANALHWFNPLMYLMQKEAVVDMELSCDERVVKDTVFETRKAYTETLLATLCRTQRKSTALSTQFFGDKTVMKKRFKNIMTRARKRSGLTVLIVVLAAVAVLGAVLGLSVGEPEMEEAQRMLAVANDFKDAYVAGNREAMKALLADTYEGDLDIQPVTDLDDGRGVDLFGYPQPGDLSVNIDDERNVTMTNAPVGSTFTALSRTTNRKDPVDALAFSFIKQENGWKIRDYELVNFEEAHAILNGDPDSVIDSKESTANYYAARDFARAFLSGDTQVIKPLLDESYHGIVTVYPGRDGAEKNLDALRPIPQQGDLSNDSISKNSIERDEVPLGSTYTVRMQDSGQSEGDYLDLSMVRREDGWKIYGYEFVRFTGARAEADPVEATGVLGAEPSDSLAGTEGEKLSAAASAFAAAYFQGDTEKVGMLVSESYMGSTSPYAGPAVDITSGSLKFAPQLGDMSITKGDEPSVYDENVPLRSAMTVLLELEDHNFYMIMVKEASGWKVYDFRYELAPGGLDDDARQIAQLAEDFTYAYFASDPDVVASYLTTPHGPFSAPSVSSEPFLGIHAIKGIPEYKTPPKVGARAAISVEFRYVGDDSYSYLSMELAKKEDGWKVYSYGVEK